MIYFKFNPNINTIYFTTDIFNTAKIEDIINKQELIETSTYTKYGTLSETKRAIQAGLLWNIIYTPEEIGIFAPVARAWVGGTNQYELVIFCWDNIFASYMLSLDIDGLDLSLSNLIQVIKSKTVYGFIPNFKETKM